MYLRIVFLSQYLLFYSLLVLNDQVNFSLILLENQTASLFFLFYSYLHLPSLKILSQLVFVLYFQLIYKKVYKLLDVFHHLHIYPLIENIAILPFLIVQLLSHIQNNFYLTKITVKIHYSL